MSVPSCQIRSPVCSGHLGVDLPPLISVPMSFARGCKGSDNLVTDNLVTTDNQVTGCLRCIGQAGSSVDSSEWGLLTRTDEVLRG
jgi:hypothetical protein